MKAIQLKEYNDPIPGLTMCGNLRTSSMHTYPKPKGPFDTFNSESTMSSITQIPWGLYVENPKKEAIFPMHITCGFNRGEYFFEEIRLQEMSHEHTGRYTRFSSEFSLGDDGLPHSIPNSFIETENYLTELHPDYSDEIHSFLLDLFTEHTLMSRYSECLGTCHERAVKLYTKATQQQNAMLCTPYQYPTDKFMGGDFYIADYKWVVNCETGTMCVTYDDDFDFAGNLSTILVNAYRHNGEGHGITISISVSDNAEVQPVAEFHSDNTLPRSIPQASLNAIKFVKERYPDEANTVGSLILGRTAEFLNLSSYAYVDERYGHIVKLFEQATASPAPTIRTDDGAAESKYSW